LQGDKYVIDCFGMEFAVIWPSFDGRFSRAVLLYLELDVCSEC